ncbi:MAG TPA: phosphatase PAP2 family protein, partial [Gemmatimonadaceae bacterium]|nr:phosphatase PAP2 family protein [Gemmatimonadaceae bacterium]
MKSYYKILSLALGLSTPAVGGALAAQSNVAAPHSLFTWEDGILAGGFAVATFAVRPLDKPAATFLQGPGYQQNRYLQKTATIVRTIALPGSIVIGASMYGAGRISKDEQLAELGLYGTEALFAGAAVGSILKDTFGRARPFVDTAGPNPNDFQLLRGFHAGDNYRSFPSGHSVAAFAAAAAVSAETSRWWPHGIYVVGPAMYGGAAAVGVSRMYNNRHWASDVILGAAIGTFAGMKIVRYNRLHPGSTLDRWLLDTS